MHLSVPFDIHVSIWSIVLCENELIKSGIQVQQFTHDYIVTKIGKHCLLALALAQTLNHTCFENHTSQITSILNLET